MDLLWKEGYLRDPWKWPDCSNGTAGAPLCSNRGIADFKHKMAQEELTIRGVLPQQVNDREFHSRKRKQVHQDDATAFVASLKACAKQKDLGKGTKLHSVIREAGLLGTNDYIATGLIDMYAKCGALAKAQKLLDELPVRSVVSWNALITGYAQQEHGQEALKCFDQMQQQGFSPDAITLTCVLKACSSIGAAEKGEEIHAEIVRRRLLEKDTILATALVDMYAKCGMLAKARDVLNELPVREVFSWNALIAGYAQRGHGHEALNCFRQMQCQGLSPTHITFTCIIKACSSINAVDSKIEEVHAQVVGQGWLKKNPILGTALVDVYAKYGALAKAQEVFDELPVQDVVSWNALIAGYTKHEYGHEAINCFEQMRHQGLLPNAVTFISILKACSCIRAGDKGEEIHGEVVRQGLLEKNINLGTALVDMYAKCGALKKAREVFDELPVPDVAAWNALIAGYAEHGQGHEALNCFEWMQQKDLSPDAITFTCILKACGSIRATEKGETIHAEVARQGLIGTNAILSTALVDMYAKCGKLDKAQEVFDKLPYQRVVSWNALITGYVQHGHGHEALNCFEQMQQQGLSPNAITFTCALKACGTVGAAEKGKEIHFEIVRQGLLKNNTILGTALVDMYAQFGTLEKAQEVFDELPVQDVVSWNVLMAGYAQLGKAKTVFSLFNKMVGESVQPDPVTFIVLLNACSHSGLVDEGQMYFKTMSARYSVIPTLDHHVCMVDLYARAGYFDKAIRMIEEMPPSGSSDYILLWLALLGACRKWGNVRLGRLAFEHILQLDEKDGAAYVLMSSIYAAASMWVEADRVEAMRVKNKAMKLPGCCWWTDVDGNVHSFVAGDTSHPQSKSIHRKLKDISERMLQEGYPLRLHLVSEDISTDAKEDILCKHSEKLAIACALINTPKGTPIRVTKNTQACGDCHLVTSLISKWEKRKIVVKDKNRFHIFEDGKCACGEYC